MCIGLLMITLGVSVWVLLVEIYYNLKGHERMKTVIKAGIKAVWNKVVAGYGVCVEWCYDVTNKVKAVYFNIINKIKDIFGK